jgi:hypothetical protein
MTTRHRYLKWKEETEKEAEELEKRHRRSSKIIPGDDVWSGHYGQGYVIELLDKKGFPGDATVSFNMFDQHIHVSVKSLTKL